MKRWITAAGILATTAGVWAAPVLGGHAHAWGNGHICWQGTTYEFPTEQQYYYFLNTHPGATEGDCVVVTYPTYPTTTTTTEAPTTTTTTTVVPDTVVVPTTLPPETTSPPESTQPPVDSTVPSYPQPPTPTGAWNCETGKYVMNFPQSDDWFWGVPFRLNPGEANEIWVVFAIPLFEGGDVVGFRLESGVRPADCVPTPTTPVTPAPTTVPPVGVECIPPQVPTGATSGVICTTPTDSVPPSTVPGAVDVGPTTPTVPPPPVLNGELPVTGKGTGKITIAASIVLGLGVLSIFLTRRRKIDTI